MSEKYTGFTITLEKDVNDTEKDRVMNAIMMIKGVSNVDVVESQPIIEHMARNRLKHDFYEKLFKVIDEL
jgi:cell division protein FtsX